MVKTETMARREARVNLALMESTELGDNLAFKVKQALTEVMDLTEVMEHLDLKDQRELMALTGMMAQTALTVRMAQTRCYHRSLAAQQ